MQGILLLARAPNSFTLARVAILIVDLLGVAWFSYIVAKRVAPLRRGERDFRFDRPFARLARLLQFWLGQWKHPRYRFAGPIHIFIFAGFLVLATHTFSLLIPGSSENLVITVSGKAGHLYDLVTDYAATIVFLCIVIAATRRLVLRPARYAVPAKFGRARTIDPDAIFLLGLIAILMVADSFFAATQALTRARQGATVEPLAFLSLAWVFKAGLVSASLPTVSNLRVAACLGHATAFYFLMCYRPFGIQFHVITSIFNVYFSKLDRGTLKPVKWGVADENLDQVKSFGVKRFEDFTWKHMLDFYSCADCGRCSDNCPANAVGRPLSPRFITIKARDYSFEHYPVFGSFENGTRAGGACPEPFAALKGELREGTSALPALIGSIYSEDEIWSCTTCGACQEECPLLVEYIDKIVDLRRGMIDDGTVPQSLQKPLKALESRGNPYGKLDKKRGDWAKGKDFAEACKVKVLDGKNTNGCAGTLYFVDSITSYDDRMQSIGRATARILDHVGANFGILGATEKDSGHEVRRFGEEMLFMALRDHNTDAIRASGAKCVVTNDPHALNALKHDYKGVPPVEHISQVIAREVKAGKITFDPLENGTNVYTYHDPCYLGRHNQIYDDPREALDAIPGLKRVEMSRARDRSFCCGGGGLMLFYEPKEDERMGVRRVRMAAEAGANVIVTACPFCMVNIEDAIKVAGLEGKMTAIDLAELVDKQIARGEARAL